MKMADGIRLVGRNLVRRKGRTMLTALGVAIGTAAIVGMISLALGLKENAIKSFSEFQDITTLEVYQGFSNRAGADAQPKRLTSESVKELKRLPGVVGVMPQISLAADLQIKLGRKVGHVQVIGIDAAEAHRFNFKVAEGRFLSGAKNEAVISYMVPEAMYEEKRKSRSNNDEQVSQDVQVYYGPMYGEQGSGTRTEMVNKTLTLSLRKITGEDNLETREYKVKVTGMLSEGRGIWGPVLYLPIELVKEMNKWVGNTGNMQVSSRGRPKEAYENIQVKVASREEVEQVVQGIKDLGYQTWSPAETLKEINKFFLVVQLILGGVAAVSLLVASIGIMNTMFMSILERTREIGIMKVLGASIPNIRSLFLLESGLIGLLGGLSGLLVGYGIVFVVNMLPKQNMFGAPGETVAKIAIVPLWLVLFAIGFSVMIGVISGLLPAHRAAKISPLQAIRQE